VVAPNRIVLEYLRMLGVLTLPGVGQWGAVAGPMPVGDAGPYVSVMNSGGVGIGRTARDTGIKYRPRVQVSVRGADDPSAADRANDILSALGRAGVGPSDGGWGRAPVLVEGELWTLDSAHMLTPPMPTAYDQDRDLITYSANYEVSVTQVTPSNKDTVFPTRSYS
jgi:hypothetical protein